MAAKTTLLTALGYSVELDELYSRLRPQSGRELARIAAAMLRTPDELLSDVEPLVEGGIVRLRGDRLDVATPVETLRREVEVQAAHAGRAQRLLGGVGRAIEVLADEQQIASGLDDPLTEPLRGEVWVGPGDVFERVRSAMLDDDGDLLWLRPDQWRDQREGRMVELVAEIVASGRASRAIYPVRVLHDAPEQLAARLRAGEQVRVLPELPTRLLIIGDSHAVVPEPLGMADLPLTVVQQSGLVASLQLWFEELWGRAAVPALDGDEPRLDLRRFLLEQLASGAHDEQIARKLGISLRTVRRRVADLMTELGADSRFQAGVEAARRGWL